MSTRIVERERDDAVICVRTDQPAAAVSQHTDEAFCCAVEKIEMREWRGNLFHAQKGSSTILLILTNLLIGDFERHSVYTALHSLRFSS